MPVIDLDPTGSGAWLPLAIFIARVVDVALGVLRNLYANQGMRWQAGLAGFFEILLWVFAIAGVVSSLDDPATILAFAGGYAVGTMVGIWLEERIALGYRVIRVMNIHQEVDVGLLLRAQGFRATQLTGHGYGGPVEVVLAMVPRRQVRRVRELISDAVPDAFYTIERVDRAVGGSMPADGRLRAMLGLLRR